MRTLCVLLCVFGAASAELLEMTVTGPEAAASGIATVRATGEKAPAYAPTDLPLMPGWPKTVGAGWYSPSRGVATADLDGDGRLEVIFPSGDGYVYVWRYDGTAYPGWPVNLSVDSCQYAAAVADVDRDGQLDIAVGTRSFVSGSGPVYLFDAGGRTKPGWPFRGGGGYFNEAPTLADVDGDDTLEVIACERRGNLGYLYVARHDGSTQPGAWPVTLDHVPATGAAAGDLDGDGTVEIVQASYNSMYVVSGNGTVRTGWPVTMPGGRNWSYQSPVLADIDGDDTLEIITAMHKEGGASIVFRHDGTVQPGWPQVYGYWTYCPPTVCDLYRDGDLKILCGTSAGVMGFTPVQHAHDGDGTPLAGFPYVSETGSNEPNITVADIDGDADMEIIFTSNRITSADSLGYVYALHDDGTLVSGFPLRPWGFTYLSGPNVADVDGDDSLDIIAVSSYAGRTDVTIWEAGVPFNRAA
ncbi:MAG: VCBS repeat-containing protein, partial [bacterium]